MYLKPFRESETFVSAKHYVNILLFLYPIKYIVGFGKVGEPFTEKDKVSKIINDFFCGELVESMLSA